MANFANQSSPIDYSRLYSTLKDDSGNLYPMDDKFVPGVKLSEKSKSYESVPELAHLSALRNSQDDAARGEAVYEAFIKMGVNADNVFNSNRQDSGQPINFANKHNVKLGRSGDSLLTTTSLITGVMEAITPFMQPEIFELFPEMSYGAWNLLIDKIDPIAGIMDDSPLGSPVKVIKKRGFNTYSVQLPQAGNVAIFTQEDILSLRSPGSNDLALRGLSQMISYISRQLEHMGKVRRMNDIYQALINNQVKWQGQTYSLGIPGANFLTSSTLGGVWGTISSSGVVCSATANPITQLANLLNFTLTKQRGLRVSMFLNHKTNQLATQNANVISRVSNIYANPNVQGTLYSPTKATGGATVDTWLKYYLGGDLNINVVIDSSQYIAGANDINGYTEGTINTLLPDGKIYFFIDTTSFGGPIGEYAYTLSVQNGGAMNPRSGKYFYMQDTAMTQTAEGIQQPQLVLGHGFNGGIRLFYPGECYTLDVLA